MERNDYNGDPVWTKATVEPSAGQKMYDLVADACGGNRLDNGEVRFSTFDDKACGEKGFCVRALKSAARLINEEPKAQSEIIRREHRLY